MVLQFNSGQQITETLTGSELVEIDNGGAVVVSTTTQAIADLAASGLPTANTNITTVGNGTLTGAAIAGGIVTRTGPIAAFSDATDTAANIVKAIPGAFVGMSFPVTIKNGTAFAETLTAGVGVTLPATVVIPANSAGTYLVTLTSLTAVTLYHISTVLTDGVTPAQFTTAAFTVGTLAAGQITGAAVTVLQNTGVTPGAQTTRTAAQMLADFPQARVGMAYMLRIINTGAGTLTLTADASVTLTGHAAILTNTFVDYIVTFVTATTASIQSIGAGTSP